jgi:hypothetical protein
MRRVSSSIYLIAIVTGVFAAAGMVWIGELLGTFLEGVLRINLRSWEFAVFQVTVLIVPGAAVVAFLGALSRSWRRGLAIGMAVHAVLFLGLVTLTDSFGAAPASVNLWVLVEGITGGALAGFIGGALAQAALRQEVQPQK